MFLFALLLTIAHAKCWIDFLHHKTFANWFYFLLFPPKPFETCIVCIDDCELECSLHFQSSVCVRLLSVEPPRCLASCFLFLLVSSDWLLEFCHLPPETVSLFLGPCLFGKTPFSCISIRALHCWTWHAQRDKQNMAQENTHSWTYFSAESVSLAQIKSILNYTEIESVIQELKWNKDFGSSINLQGSIGEAILGFW